MVYTFHCAHSHLKMLLNDIIIVSVMISDDYTITDTGYSQKWLILIYVSSIGASLINIILSSIGLFADDCFV